MTETRENFLEITDHDKLLTAGMALRNVSKEYMEDHVRKAIITREYYLGNQYLRAVGDRIERRFRRAGDQWRPQTTRNIIGQTIDPVHAIIAGARPLTNIEACFPDQFVQYKDADGAYQRLSLDGEATAEKSTEVMDTMWNAVDRKEAYAVSQVILDSLMSGTSFRAYGTSIHPHRGKQITVKHLQPDQVYLDPDGRDLITFSDFRYVIIKVNMDVAAIKNTWPNVKESDYGSALEGTTYDDTSSRGFISRIFNRKGPPRQDDAEMISEWSLRKYPVYILYYAGHMPQLVETESDKKFPNGRLLIWINDMKIVHDGDIETRGFTYPLVGFTPNPVPHMSYGHSEAEKLIGPQDIINSFSNTVVANALYSGHTQLLVESGAIDRKNWSVNPGAILTAAKDALRSGRIKQLFPGPIGREIVEYMLNLEHYSKEELGDADGLLRGRTGGTSSGIHAQTVRDSAYNRHAFRIGLLDYSYEQCAYKEFSMIQQYLPLDNQYYQGYYQIDPEMALAMQNLIFKIKLESRKDLPFSGLDQMNMYFALAQEGYLTIKEFYELTKIPISQEWKTKVEEASEESKPGIPLRLQAEMELKEQQVSKQQAALAEEKLQTGRSTQETLSGSGGGQQTPTGADTVGTVGTADQIQKV